MEIWLNVGSLIFGLLAWLLPVAELWVIPAIVFIKGRRTSFAGGGVLSILSFFACAVSLCMQTFYVKHLVAIEDWSALMDTIGAVRLASIVLLVVTILLNTAAYCKRRSAKR